MKIIITSSGNKPESQFDLRFGRAAYFCVFDTEEKTTEFIINNNAESAGGAGTKSAEKIIELGAQRIISGDFGPKAKELLNKFKIQMVMLDDANCSIQSIINKML